MKRSLLISSFFFLFFFLNAHNLFSKSLSNAGGDSKTLMFVQINLWEHDLGETLSSLNFASQVPGTFCYSHSLHEFLFIKWRVKHVTDHDSYVILQLDKARQETKFKRLINKEGKRELADHGK